MSRIRILTKSLMSQPGYTLMRVPARFGFARDTVSRTRGLLQGPGLRRFLAEREARLEQSVFKGIDKEQFVRTLDADGLAFGLKIPGEMVAQIRQFADSSACFADRDPARGFRAEQRAAAESVLGKPILVAQYFNTQQRCAAIDALRHDPLLEWIAARYIGSVPAFVGSNLWWTFPVKAREEDRFKHAHLYHRDVDCFRFFKFFFYLTDVEPGDGAHVAVAGSHRRPPVTQRFDEFKVRRYTDAEIDQTYDRTVIKEICGEAGTGFAENTLCIHKGRTPVHQARLLLQLQFAMFDYGVMHDQRREQDLSLMV